MIPRTELEKGASFAAATGGIVRVIGPEGIFKPRDFQLPLSITTSPKSPYEDRLSPEGYLLYKYRGTDPQHSDNVGLRECALHNTPLVYFRGLIAGRYFVTWPVFIQGDDPANLQFSVSVDQQTVSPEQAAADPETPIRRRYTTVLARQRIHQHAFRERVVAAYRTQCAMCRLRHGELLDAAHIVPDSLEGEPKVPNGMALCKLHHAAFEGFMVSVSPDYRIQVRRSLLDEEDGPVLEHALKGLHGIIIQLPSRTAERPDRDALAWHLERFRAVA
ncbi:MAG: HNH endonuclease [Verrucomicrobiia bacterium]